MTDEEVLEGEVEAEEAPTPTAAPRPHPPTPQGSMVERAWEVQDRLAQKWQGLGRGRIARVLRMARKPEPEELRHSAFVVLVGIAVIGAIGFFTYLAMNWFLKAITPI